MYKYTQNIKRQHQDFNCQHLWVTDDNRQFHCFVLLFSKSSKMNTHDLHSMKSSYIKIKERRKTALRSPCQVILHPLKPHSSRGVLIRTINWVLPTV